MTTEEPIKVKRFVIPYTEKAKENLKAQQSRYMKKHGRMIRTDDLAGILLETAVLK